jgi:phosphate transport system protein
VHFIRDLESLQQELLAMSSLVGDLVHRGVDELRHPNPESALQLAGYEEEIDRYDVQIEDACLKILALYQPVAGDLRRVTAVLKIGAELERIADLGINIAERAAAMASLPPVPIPQKLDEMVIRAVDMLDRSIRAYVELDNLAARQIRAEDDEVDNLNAEIIEELTEMLRATPKLAPPLMHLFSACRNVERLADHATNIAEDIIYLVEGEIIRHRSEIPSPTS